MKTTRLIATATLIGLGTLALAPAGGAPSTRAALDDRPLALADMTPAKLRTAVERVVVFKDGYALIAKSATGTADADGRVFLDNVPGDAVLGCFWAIGENQKVLAMRSEWDESREVRRKETACLAVGELLKANVGKRVTLGLPEKRTVTGTIVELLQVPAETRPAGAQAVPGFVIDGDADSAGAMELMRQAMDQRPDMGGVADGRATMRRELAPRGGDFVVVDETETGRLVLPVSQVQTISGKEVVTRTVREEEVFTRAKRLSFDMGKDLAGKPVSLKVFYFSAGMRWIPTYRVSGELKDKVDLSLQGEIINDLEDIDKAALDMVVGVPNFRFKDQVSPLSLEKVMRGALAQAYNGRNNDLNNLMSNGNSQIYGQAAGSWRGREVGGGGAPTLAAELATSGEQDLFLYSMKDFSLKKGARATAPLWQNSVPLRHVYTFDVNVTRNRQTGAVGSRIASRRAPGGAASPLKLSTNDVWHQLELANNSTVPWTTGAALTVRDGLPIGQDMITYTPAGGCALLPLTIAVDVLGQFDEVEAGRKNNALRIDGYDYTLVRKKGTLTVTNFRKEKAQIRFSASLGGKVESASDDGKIKTNDFRAEDWEGGGGELNNHSDVTWDLAVEPGQTKAVTYEVGFYVR